MKLALLPLERILRENGAERISKGTVEEFRKEVERYAKALAETSIALAKHGGRQTVGVKDIQLVIKLS